MDIIYTNVTALYKQDIITYSPTKKYGEMKQGTNTTRYPNEYVIKTQSENTLNIGVINIDGEKYYCPERLFIELAKFQMENTVREEAIKNLKKMIDPEKTKRLYEKLKSRRGLDDEMIIQFLESNLLHIKEVITQSSDRKMVIREYIMALVSRKGVPVSIIKGGSSIELFTTMSRTTLDIDAHTGKSSIKKIIEQLTNKEMSIYFKLSDKHKELIDAVDAGEEGKKVIKVELYPVSKGGVLSKELEGIHIPISFNTSYSDKELREIKESYKITHRNLKLLKNATCIVFTREMLLAEKFQSIISKPQLSKRTKDLIDLKLLWSDDLNYKHFRKWLFRKWANQTAAKEINEAKEIIKSNRELELTKINDNFDDAVAMYGADITREECMEIYRTLAQEALK